MNALGTPGDGRKHDFGRRHGEVGAMVLADAEGIDAQLVGQHRLLDHVADHLRLRQELAVGCGGNIAERVEPKFELLCHVFCSCRPFTPPSGAMEVGCAGQRRNVAMRMPGCHPSGRAWKAGGKGRSPAAARFTNSQVQLD